MLVLELAVPKIEMHELDTLEENLRKAEKQLSEGIRCLDLNTNFHVLLARASKNALLAMFVESALRVMSDLLGLFKEPGADYGRRVLDYHRAVYEAVRRKDVEGAKEAMEEHILDIETNIGTLDALPE
jgi:GntR family transcriptional repressor for pyruvate dehydrogenase complex